MTDQSDTQDDLLCTENFEEIMTRTKRIPPVPQFDKRTNSWPKTDLFKHRETNLNNITEESSALRSSEVKKETNKNTP